MTIDTVFGIIAGALLVGLAVGMRLYAKRKDARCSSCAAGQVVANELVISRSVNDGFSSSYFPVVKFRPNGQDELTVRHRVGARPPRYKVGEHVDVKYNPNNLNEFVLPKDYKGLGFIAILLCLLGVITFGQAVFSIIAAL